MKLNVYEQGGLIRLSVTVNGDERDLGSYTKVEAIKIWENLVASEEKLAAMVGAG